MKTTLLRLAACAALAAVVLAARAGGVDEDFMRYLEDVYKSADNDIAMQDAAAAAKDAKELEALFKDVEAHFTGKGDAADGVRLSRRSVELSAAVARTVAAQDFAAASTAAQELGRACKSCHNLYKD